MTNRDALPRISVVLPTVDRAEAVYNLVRHLEHQTLKPHEIVVVDQSADENARLAALPVRVHRIRERGLPNARNVGVGLATGDVVLFLDDDSIPSPGLVEAHARRYSDPGVHGVGGRVLGGYDRAGGVPGRFDPASGRVSRNFSSEQGGDADHLPGGNMSFRREVFGRAGGFDPAYGGSAIGEETDFCLRVRRAGFRLVYEPAAVLEHLHLPTGGCRAPRFESWLYWQSHNSMLFALRHARAAALPFFLLKRVLRLGLFALERGSPSLVATGLHGLLRGMATHAQGT
jgi:GT2 family glycosyltransferase